MQVSGKIRSGFNLFTNTEIFRTSKMENIIWKTKKGDSVLFNQIKQKWLN